MKKVGMLALVLAAATSLSSFGEESFCDWYAGGTAQILLPQGGSRMHSLGGGAVRVGRYLTESLAVECEAAWLENSCGLSARAVWHLHGWREFDMLFGYERFDPFVTVGARGWIHDGQIGPAAGIGAFYYLTDDWALRFDADATLGLDTGIETAYTLSVGVQRFF